MRVERVNVTEIFILIVCEKHAAEKYSVAEPRFLDAKPCEYVENGG